MTIDETKTLLKRIKSNYSEFVMDDYNIKEWHKELKDYDFDDVNEKLEAHFRNEEYGAKVPKVYFLTKYLKTIQEKQTIKKYIVGCPLCDKSLDLAEFEKHYTRCSSVDYIATKSLKIFGKEVNKDNLFKMSQKEFDDTYTRLLNAIVDKVPRVESKLIIKQLYPEYSDIEIEDVLNAMVKEKKIFLEEKEV